MKQPERELWMLYMGALLGAGYKRADLLALLPPEKLIPKPFQQPVAAIANSDLDSVRHWLASFGVSHEGLKPLESVALRLADVVTMAEVISLSLKMEAAQRFCGSRESMDRTINDTIKELEALREIPKPPTPAVNGGSDTGTPSIPE